MDPAKATTDQSADPVTPDGVSPDDRTPETPVHETRSEAEALATPVETGWSRFGRRFRSQGTAVAAAGFLAFMVLVSIFAPFIMTHPPNEANLLAALSGPSAEHWLGTDDLGRDIFSRLIYAGRLSLQGAGIAVVVALVLGVPAGLVAGYSGGWLDTVIMRIVDGVMVFPSLILAIAIVGIMGPGLTNAMIAIGITYFPYFARIVRGSTLTIKEEVYVHAARSIGAPSRMILRRHILPNILSPLIVQSTLALGLAILSEAALSFIGLGAQTPEASWGSMLRRAFTFIDHSMLGIILPGVMIMLVVLAFNLAGDGLRDALGRETRTGK